MNWPGVGEAKVCKCGHDLSSHPPDPAHPFDWPCKECECMEYDEVERING